MNSCLRALGGANASHRARFPALWCLLLTGLVLALAPGAQAAPAPVPSPAPPDPAAGAPFGVQAGLYGLTTLTGGHFGYALKAGARIEDSAVIYNESDEARTFHVYGADVAHAAGGGLAPAQEGQQMRAVGAWLKLDSEASVTVQPKSKATVRFSLAVPDGTPPGSHLGSLVTALRTPAVSGGVNTETRIARLVEVTVPGTADLQVSLTELEHRPAGGGEEFTVTVRNTGNVLYTFAGTLNITGGSSARTVPLTPTGIYVIPGGSATVTGRLADLPALGRRAVTASVTASVPGGAAKTVESNTVRLSYFPWLIASLTVAGLLALGLLLVITRKRWRARLRRRAEERTALRALRRELRAGNPPAGDPHEAQTAGVEHP
ncbi:COG1470 family protein [Streptomyces erythrochromogenes]|uniref:COG1470 family protein n=1 Tax=Streptomyces erythrochromogenes TaxID=285574 RepID=UPI00367484CA